MRKSLSVMKTAWSVEPAKLRVTQAAIAQLIGSLPMVDLALFSATDKSKGMKLQ